MTFSGSRPISSGPERTRRWRGTGSTSAKPSSVGTYYRNRYSDFTIDGKDVDPNNPEHLAARSLFLNVGSKEAALVELKEHLDDVEFGGSGSDKNKRLAETTRRAIKLLQDDAPLPEVKSAGHLYEVSVDARPDQFIDLDAAPTPELAGLIKEKFGVAAKEGGTAKDLIVAAGKAARPKQVSAALSEAGYAGSRYLDGELRERGVGTSNFVVFDDQRVTITKRNGEPFQPTAAASTGPRHIPGETDTPPTAPDPANPFKSADGSWRPLYRGLWGPDQSLAAAETWTPDNAVAKRFATDPHDQTQLRTLVKDGGKPDPRIVSAEIHSTRPLVLDGERVTVAELQERMSLDDEDMRALGRVAGSIRGESFKKADGYSASYWDLGSAPEASIPAAVLADQEPFLALAQAKGFDALATRDSMVAIEPAIVKRTDGKAEQAATDAADAAALRQRERQDLADAVARKAPASDLLNSPLFADTVRQMEEIPETHKAPGYLSPEWRASREFDFDGEKVVGYEPAIARLTQDAETFSKAGPVKQERQAFIVLGPPAAGKSTLAEKIAVNEYAAIVDPDEAKKTLPEFQGELGANAVHEESGTLADEVGKGLVLQGKNLVIPKVGGTPGGIERIITHLTAAGYEVHLVNLLVSPDEAFRRMVGRFLSKGRLINPDYFRSIGDGPKRTYDQLKGSAKSYAEVNAEGPPESLFTTEATGRAEAAVSADGGRGRELREQIRGYVGENAQERRAETAPTEARQEVKRNALGLPEGKAFGPGTDDVKAADLAPGDWIIHDGQAYEVRSAAAAGEQVELTLAGLLATQTVKVDGGRAVRRKRIIDVPVVAESGTAAASVEPPAKLQSPAATSEATPGRPAGVFAFEASDLKVDAQRFQYKDNGDDEGVTTALKGVKRWDQAKAGQVIVWQAEDGTYYVADGHQRSGLARRLKAEGKADATPISGILYREFGRVHGRRHEGHRRRGEHRARIRLADRRRQDPALAP